MTEPYNSRFRKLMQLTLVAEASFWGAVILLYTFVKPRSMDFLHPGMFWFFLLIPVLFVVFVLRWQWKSKLYDTYRGMGKTRMIRVRFQPIRYFLQYFLLRCVVFFIVTAMAQPVMGSRKVKGSRRVLDLVICLDISASMNTMDIAPNTSRLDVAKRGIIQLLNNLKGERISVVIFANEAYTQLPLTMDYGAAKMFIQEIETAMISDQGTNVGAALEVAQEQFRDSESGHAIVVITDGEDHEQQWRDQVAKIRESKVELSYYGIGTTKGGLIPNDPDDLSAGYKRENGVAVVSRLDQDGLRKMAAATNSNVEFSNAAFPDMTGLIAELSSVQNKTVKEMEFQIRHNYFQVPLFVAFCCFLAYLFVPLLVNRE